jgi:hypothetical protein
MSTRYITLNESFLCCSRLHYENLSYISEQCTYEGEIKGYNTFDSNKCTALKKKAPSSTNQSTLTPVNTPTDLLSSSHSTQATTPVIPPLSSTPRAAAAFRISNFYVWLALSLVLFCFS